MLKTNRRTGKISLRNLDQVDGGKSSSAIYAKKNDYITSTGTRETSPMMIFSSVTIMHVHIILSIFISNKI